LITVGLGLVIANFVPLEAIATMGSAGFLLVFMAVNIANVRLSRDTGGGVWISMLAAISTAVALVVLCVQVAENPATSRHLWILLGMIVVSFGIEIVYRRLTGRKIRLVDEAQGDCDESTQD
jgi:amino acid transporter